MVILGIDPGLSGALALYDPARPIEAQVYDIPTWEGGIDPRTLAQVIASIRAQYPDVVAVVENVHSLPRQAGAFAFGLGAGIIHGCLASNGIEFSLLAPSLWKPRMGLQRFAGETPAENKTRARALAIQLFPHLTDKLKLVKHDGRAEALLIAVFASGRR